MDALGAAFTALGFGCVRTLLASGNVIFETVETDTPALASGTEAGLREKFGTPIPVIVRSLDRIRSLVDADPFAGINVTPQTRLYATFLSEAQQRALAVPSKSREGDFTIIHVTATEVFSVLDLSRAKSPAAMQALDKLFGSRVTTRNWNTVRRLASR